MVRLFDIIIVNWNSGNQLKECVDSIFSSDISDLNFRLIIVDNNSSDDSLEKIDKNENIIKIKNNYNNGFGRACNQAYAISNADFVLLLNPDTILNPNTFKLCLAYMNANTDITVMGVKQFTDNGEVLKTCSRYLSLRNILNYTLGLSSLYPSLFPQNLMKEWDHNNPAFVDHVMGSFMFIRKDALEKLDFFMDDDYFVYFEDLDLSYRLHKNGGKFFYNSNIEIYHKGGGTSEQVKPARLFYSIEGKITYVKKHFNILKKSISICLILFVEPIVRLIFNLAKGNIEDMKSTLIAYGRVYKKIFDF